MDITDAVADSQPADLISYAGARGVSLEVVESVIKALPLAEDLGTLRVDSERMSVSLVYYGAASSRYAYTLAYNAAAAFACLPDLKTVEFTIFIGDKGSELRSIDRETLEDAVGTKLSTEVDNSQLNVSVWDKLKKSLADEDVLAAIWHDADF